MEESGYIKDDPGLDAIFSALADPTRRAILSRLSSGQATVNEIAAPFEMSQPAVSRHLKVLERAGLIERFVDEQRRPARLKADNMALAAAGAVADMLFCRKQCKIRRSRAGLRRAGRWSAFTHRCLLGTLPSCKDEPVDVVCKCIARWWACHKWDWTTRAIIILEGNSACLRYTLGV